MPLIGCLFFAALMLLGASIAPELFARLLHQTNQLLLDLFLHYYLLLGLGVVVVAVCLSLSPLARHRLGNQSPEYSLFTWVALLYSTGMGSGLLLRAVQEPIYYLIQPPIATADAATLAMQYTFFHWGVTPWAFYSLFGLLVAYNYYHRNSPSLLLAISPTSSPQTRRLDAVFLAWITVVGVIASLALGAGQLVGGLNALHRLQLKTPAVLIAVITMGIVATLSAMSGIKRVIRYLADFDFLISLFLMIWVAAQIDEVDSWQRALIAAKRYGLHFIEMSLSLSPYRTDRGFTQNWTVFYWAFWLAWVPFTGIFMARISKGRTVRQFLLTTIAIPTLATMLWFAVFGGKAMETLLPLNGYDGRYDSIFTAIFNFFATLPGSSWTNGVVWLLILVAIVNSVDSAIFVLGMISDHGQEDPSPKHKIVWGGIITLTAAALILIGHNDLLSAVSQLLTILALPFSFFYIWIVARFFGSFYPLTRRGRK